MKEGNQIHRGGPQSPLSYAMWRCPPAKLYIYLTWVPVRLLNNFNKAGTVTQVAVDPHLPFFLCRVTMHGLAFVQVMQCVGPHEVDPSSSGGGASKGGRLAAWSYVSQPLRPCTPCNTCTLRSFTHAPMRPCARTPKHLSYINAPKHPTATAPSMLCHIPHASHADAGMLALPGAMQPVVTASSAGWGGPEGNWAGG